MLPEAKILTRHGYGVMLLDPHPCAGPGVVHTMGQAEVADVAAATRFMQQQPDVTQDKIGVLGFSVAEGNFDDLITNITPRGAQGTLIGELVQSFIVFFFRYYTGADPALVRPIDSVAKITPRPLLFIAGQGEAEANRTLAQFEAAGEPKSLWLVPDVGHGGYGNRWPAEYERRIVDFFDRALLAGMP
jgi:hypothetical protein